MARTYLHLYKVEEAQESANRAVQSDKDLSDALTAQGEVYFRQGHINEAEKIFRVLIQSKKADARAYLGMADV